MYFEYVTNWLYRLMKVPIPLVLSENVYGLVTIFDLFLFTVYLGVFIVLIKYMITDSLSLNVGGVDINYSSDAYVARQYRNAVSNHINKSNERKAIAEKKKADYAKGQQWLNERRNRAKTYSNSIGGRILANKNAGRISASKNNNSIGSRILAKKKK